MTTVSPAVFADSFFRDLIVLSRRDDLPLRGKYAELYRVLHTALNERTAESSLQFSGPFAKLDFLCKEAGLEHESYARINDCRIRCRRFSSGEGIPTKEDFACDLKTLSDFLSFLYARPVPAELCTALPRRATKLSAPLAADCLRVVVEEWGERFLTVRCDAEGGEVLRVDHITPGRFGSHAYLRPRTGGPTMLNLIRPRRTGNTLTPELIILEPDYLVDITAVARCFESYGRTHLAHLLGRLRSAANSSAILLGLFAGQLLDEVIHGDDEGPDYATSVRRFFKENALSLATCPDLSPRFHEEARGQLANLKRMVGRQFREDRTLNPERALLEPSFVCERLGLQGRMDLLQQDLRVLVEQKSGKKDFRTGGHKEQHYVQMLLYLAVLHYGFGLRNDEVSCYLMYSRYADGLIRETPAPLLLGEALRLRNELVRAEFGYACGEAAEVLDALTPERLNTAQTAGKLWEQYTRPELARLLATVQEAPELERAYFHRFFAFVAKEHLLSKIGTPAKENSGFASLWNATLAEKRQTGDIICNLFIEERHKNNTGCTERLVLTLPPETDGDDCLPNFRTGDIVLLYPYKADGVPDVRRGLVFRASIEELADRRLVAKLRAPQRDAVLPADAPSLRWAVEHDFMEASYTALYRSLHAFLSAPAARRDLLLGRRQPCVDESLTLRLTDGCGASDFDRLTLRAMQARDLFLLIGPPGTGKTSLGLTHILKEELACPDASVLLASFTNRAVEEICSKLVLHGIDFLRIGPAAACDDAYRSRLLENRVADARNAKEVRLLLNSVRVVVGTTTSLSSAMRLFTLKKFSLAIIDEASQILEPHLLGLLSAKATDGDCAIGRFVLIGDHKQLPAVVQQSETESAVANPLLRDIGLTNCRHSLFERLLRLYGNDERLHFLLRRQGRMHPDVARFANEHFYGGHLLPVPLPHQQAGQVGLSSSGNSLTERATAHRLAFVHVGTPATTVSEKANPDEARVAAALVLALCQRRHREGRSFDAATSVGVIVPYRNQIAMVRRELERLAVPDFADISIDTVERYQGSERDAIIYSFTVQKPHQLAFLTSNRFEEGNAVIDRKLNVALTRAREQLFIVGNAHLLSADPIFNALIRHAEALGAFFRSTD